jgi:hypothetical protein
MSLYYYAINREKGMMNRREGKRDLSSFFI